jgi:hypothetical protein
MLLSPGTVISISIRGARLIRNSIDELKESDTGCLMLGLMKKATAALLQHPVSSIEGQPQPRKHSGQ